jgi:hypothetical protein
MERDEHHHQLFREKQASIIYERERPAKIKKLEATKNDHAINLRAHPLATDSDAFLRYAHNVAEAAEALHRVGQVKLSEQCGEMAARLYYFTL